MLKLIIALANEPKNQTTTSVARHEGSIRFTWRFLFPVLFLFFASIKAQTNIYYSVGQATSDMQTGSSTLTIVGGAGVFSMAQNNNIGVGDKVTYGTGSVAYIAAKTDTDRMHWALLTASGTIPPDIDGVAVVSIKRAFHSLSSALSGAKDANHLRTLIKLNCSTLTRLEHIIPVSMKLISN
ncbi:MAG: hypothetical protein V1913_05565 [Fibrobacterota bacterium]